MSRVRAPDGAPVLGCTGNTTQPFFMARWSSGQDIGLSRRKQGFDSPTSHHPYYRFCDNTSYFIVGIVCDEGPPVPIPNTEVKLISAENTWLETAWENRTMPTSIFLNSSAGRATDTVTYRKRVVEGA